MNEQNQQEAVGSPMDTKKSEMSDDLLTPGEVAEVLRISLSTLRGWVDRGLIATVVLPSGHRRYRTSEVEAILSEERS